MKKLNRIEAAKFLGVSLITLDRDRAKGSKAQIPWAKVCGKIIYDEERIQQAIESRFRGGENLY